MRPSALIAVCALMLAGCGQAAAPAPHHHVAHKKASVAQALLPVQGFDLTHLTDLPFATDRLAAAFFDGSTYIFGGLRQSGSTTAIYRLQKANLSAAGSLPLPLHDLAAAALGSHLLVMGGGQVASSPQIFSYAPATAKVTQYASFPTPLSDLAAVSLGKDVYVFGGFTGSVFSQAIYRIASGGVARVASLPLGLRYTGAAALNGSIYLFGGLGVGGYQSAIYRFTPGKGVTKIGELPSAAAAPLVAPAQGGILVVGGEVGVNQDLASVYFFTPKGGLRQIGSLPRPLGYGALVSLGKDRFVVIGGEDGAARGTGIYTLRLTR
ncbi:MAG: hypothetical protein M0Z66_04200 [Thermaerobacter sp.]|nr:hypothetical protein [Thermaerobacter sp.]